jgi:hypothetical protein
LRKGLPPSSAAIWMRLPSLWPNDTPIATVTIVGVHSNQKIHLLAQTKSVRFPDPRTAEAVVVVAMAGQPIQTAEAAERLRANIHRFEIRFVSDGGSEWRAVYADWRYAELGDLF